MKFIVFFSFVLALSGARAQNPTLDLSHLYALNNEIYVIDTMVDTFFIYENIDKFENNSREQKLKKSSYLKKRKYRLKTGATISLDILLDSIVLFSEENFSQLESRQQLNTQGELFINKQSYKIQKWYCSSSDGNDSLCIDTLFSLSPHGFWTIRKDDIYGEEGEFLNGVKQGNWITRDTRFEFFSRINRANIIVKEQVFESGRMIAEKQVNLLNELNEAELKKGLNKEWYNIGFTAEQKGYCKNNTCYLIYSRDKAKLRRAYATIFDYLDLRNDETFKFQTSRTCGLGSSGLNGEKGDFWSVKNKKLILNHFEFEIAYISGEFLVLKVMFN